jgi:hypothetical protein
MRRKIAQAFDFGGGWLGHAGASLSQPARNGKHFDSASSITTNSATLPLTASMCSLKLQP